MRVAEDVFERDEAAKSVLAGAIDVNTGSTALRDLGESMLSAEKWASSSRALSSANKMRTGESAGIGWPASRTGADECALPTG
jgi:hypothetical protein